MMDVFRLILVDDSVSDARIIERAFKESKIAHAITHYDSGSSALGSLSEWKQSPLRLQTRPRLILLDLNLPGLNGLEILSAIKADSILKLLPVVVLTTSERDQDIAGACGLGANSYIQKPADFDGYLLLVQTLHLYWGLTAVAPPL